MTSSIFCLILRTVALGRMPTERLVVGRGLILWGGRERRISAADSGRALEPAEHGQHRCQQIVLIVDGCKMRLVACWRSLMHACTSSKVEVGPLHDTACRTTQYYWGATTHGRKSRKAGECNHQPYVM